MLVTACIVVACKPQSPAPAATGGGGQNVTYPTTLADMNGWHGIQVVRSPADGRMNCSISFPPSFGMSEEERNLLIYMVAQSKAVRKKTDCWISPDDIYQALNQLLRLAIAKQNPVAASLLLYSGTTETPFNLDGEVAEGYTEHYLIPVLEKYERLETVLDHARESVIATDVCADLQWREDSKDTVFKKRIQALVGRLHTNGMGRFAREIERCMSAQRKGNGDIPVLRSLDQALPAR